jgi:hypothetical protein
MFRKAISGSAALRLSDVVALGMDFSAPSNSMYIPFMQDPF